MKEWFSIFWISSFICLHLSYPWRNLHPTPWGCLRSPQAISGVPDLSETFPSAPLCLPVHPLSLCVFPLSCCSAETVWELFREQECTGSAQSSAAGGEEGGRRRQERGIFPWMRSWMMASLRVRAELVADAPLTFLCQHTSTHTHTHWAHGSTYLADMSSSFHLCSLHHS